MLRNLKTFSKILAKPLKASFGAPLAKVSLKFQPRAGFASQQAVFSNKPVANYSYSHLPLDFFVSAHQAAEQLIRLNYSIVDKSIEIFRENLFPIDNRRKIPILIEELIKSNIKVLRPDQDPSEVTTEIFSSLKTIIDFIDRADQGLLSGDLTLSLIMQIEKILKLNIKKIKENEMLASRRDWVITSIYNDIKQVAFDAGLFRLPLHGVKAPAEENPRNLFERQLALEDESNEIAIDRFMNIYEELEKLDLAFNLKFARSRIIEWFPQLCKAIKEEQEQCLLGDLKTDRKVYASYIIKVTPEKLALISLTELMKAILRFIGKKQEEGEMGYQSYSVVSKVLFDTLGKAVNAQILFEFEEEMNKIFEDKEQEKRVLLAASEAELNALDNVGDVAPNQSRYNNQKSSHVGHKMLRKKLDSDIFEDVGISKNIQLKIGSLLTYLMKETIKIKNQEGFWENLLTTSYTKTKNGKKMVGTLQVNEEFILSLVSHVEQTDSLFIQMDRCMPMIFKPAPWQDHEIGGYYQKPTNFMRIHESLLQERSIKYADLKPMFHVLDILGQTPWRVNKKVLKVIEDLWEEGGEIGEIPPRYYNYTNYVYEYQLSECRNIKEKMKLMRKIQGQRDIHSLRCDFTLKLNVAKAFQDINQIYFPHNIDFRGRVYPIPPHLNHMGADISRGLLEFAEGKPIGPNGIYWLKVHLANKMGQDKLSMQDRVAYVESMIPLIQKCAKDPTKHREWSQFEDCWQTLSAMFELITAMESKNPEEYVSHCHIHQDGSCNGLQHYAALGKDFAGAAQVNLSHSAKPGDVYTHVANMVQERVNQDSVNPSSKYHNISKKLVGNVKRKIVKQTVMTTVYGVTFIGARKQIFKQLRDKEFMEDDDKLTYEASYYLALLTLDAVKNLFSGAHAIKAWLIHCAGLIANTSYPVSWITPLGLPVIQPYRSKSQNDVISTILQKVTLSASSDNLPINKNKQKSAFPPNYIHSLDSTHLMYTAIECQKENITFAAVHDSYWTHISTIDRLNEILRDQFIRLHSQPLLEALKESFERRYPQIDFPPIPQRGDFDLNEVKKSIYFFA